MKIIVCFKILPNPDRIVDADLDNFNLSLDLSYAGSELNCFDASSLESAIKIKEQAAVQGAEVSCTALTVSKEVPGSFCENLFAIGFDNLLQIPLADREFRPEEIASILAEEIKRQKADYVFFGKEAGFMESGSVPYLTASKLSLPIVPNIETASAAKDSLLLHVREADGLYAHTQKSPCVCIFANSPEVLRFATLKKRMLARGKKAETLCMPTVNARKDYRFARFQTGRSCQMLSATDETLLSSIRAALQVEDAAQEKQPAQDILALPNSILYSIADATVLTQEQIAALPCADGQISCFLDTPSGRKAAADFANAHAVPVRFAVQMQCADKQIEVQKRVCASNVLYTEVFSGGLVCTIPESAIHSYAFTQAKMLFGQEESFIRVAKQLEKTEKTDLASAKLLVVCGNGMGSKEAVQKARLLAQKLGAAFGLTRPAALNAWGSPSEIVGQSGTITAPQCALVLGAAGAGAFLLGIEKAKKIIAVNTDEHALLFQNADLGVKMDAEAFVDRLLQQK